MGKIIRRDPRNTDTGCYLTDVEKTILAFIEPQQYFYDVSGCSCYELLGYGVHGTEPLSSIGIIILNFYMVQAMLGMGCRNLGRLYCESFCVSAEEIKNVDTQTLIAIACECALEYQNSGHQVLYSVYRNDSGRVLIHFLVNPVNYEGCKHWCSSLQEMCSREKLFNCILKIYTSKIVTSPITFTNSGMQGYVPISMI